MNPLATEYLGLALSSPLVMSSSPLCEDLDTIRRAEDAGAAAVVLPSLFEEQLAASDLDRHLARHAYNVAEASRDFPEMASYNGGPDRYLAHLRRAKAAVDIPVIASLNGVSSGAWIRVARDLEQAGADALELNAYFVPTDPLVTGAEVEEMTVDLVRDVSLAVTLPLAVKLSHFFSAIPNLAHRLERAGARGLVLFNRFYQPDLDVERLEVIPDLTLSTSSDLRLRLRWVAILHGQAGIDLAVTGGVHTTQDVVKALMAGATVTMMTSALVRHGVEHLATLRAGLAAWMEAHAYGSLRELRGRMSNAAVAEPAAFERANYLRVLRAFALRPWRGGVSGS